MEIRELYQELIIDHSKNPKNFGVLKGADFHAEGINPLCGDSYEVFIKMDGGKISEVKFTGVGCAISKSSASMMTEAIKGKSKKEALELLEDFREMLGGSKKDLGKLSVFQGVHDYPSRVKCASLVWFTMAAAINKKKNVSTE
ncbi:MAG: Fe-S cluster assembly sulfur transfer protein SufU [Patescibacteria group bacterium]